MSSADPVRDATTVIILRACDSTGDESGAVEPFEVFMVQRTSRSSFMANAYVYPGGALDPGDSTPELLDRVTGRTPEECARVLGGGMTAERAVAFFLAGIRESFEEAGLLLAHSADDDARAWLDLHAPGRAARMALWRARLRAGESSLQELAQEENLAFALDRLHPFAHWITPAHEPKRFDTWFFVVRAPSRQDLIHDDEETVDSRWTGPRAALRDHRAGELHLFPPTYRTLEELSEADTLGNALGLYANIPIAAIEPHFVSFDGLAVALLPGDPDYPATDVVPVVGPTRIALTDRGWKSLT